MQSHSIYLDNNATTPIDPQVLEAMTATWRDVFGNAASQHQAGQRARAILEQAREGLCNQLDAERKDRLVFTSGGTESNHLALLGLAATGPGHVLVSAIEHPSVMGAASLLRKRSVEVGLIPVTKNGIVDLACLYSQLRDDTKLVSVMLANNETGVLQPVAEIAAVCRARRILVHTDAVQAVGKIAVSFRELGVDAMTLAPHKFHGPAGVGGLMIREGVRLEPLFVGGFQQEGVRPGTEPLALAVGFQESLRRVHAEKIGDQLRTLRDQFESLVTQQIGGIVIGIQSSRVPQTSCIAFPGWNRQQLFLALDCAGVACSTGSACASGSSERSPVLSAMGLPDEQIDSAIRFSFGRTNTVADVEQAVGRICRIFKQLQPVKP